MMVQTKNKRVFECITEKQAWKIYALINESTDFDYKKLYIRISSLTGISSVNSLSKQEASFIIDKLLGCNKWKRPAPPRTMDKIKGNTAELPLFSQVNFIRESVRALGWDKQHFKNWLKKHTGANNINQLTKKTARNAYIGLTKIRIQRITS